MDSFFYICGKLPVYSFPFSSSLGILPLKSPSIPETLPLYPCCPSNFFFSFSSSSLIFGKTILIGSHLYLASLAG